MADQLSKMAATIIGSSKIGHGQPKVGYESHRPNRAAKPDFYLSVTTLNEVVVPFIPFIPIRRQ